MLAMIGFSACKSHNGDNISISTKDTEGTLKFTANYPEQKTGATQAYIESYFKEDRIFKFVSDSKKIEIKLPDGTQFYLNYEPGFIEMNFDKGKNSFSSYSRMKKMIAGFGNALKD